MERNIWKIFGLALLATPMATFVGLIVITLIEAIGDAITKIQLAGYWWIILIVAYVLSFLYFFYIPTFRKNREREKIAYGLLFYWEEQLIKQIKPLPSDREREVISDLILERVKIWAWKDPKLWSRYFSNEEYSKYLFVMIDILMKKYYSKNPVKAFFGR